MRRRAQNRGQVPRRLRQLAIPLLSQITELLHLVRTFGRAIPPLADIFREIVETGVRGSRSVDGSTSTNLPSRVFTSFQSPLRTAIMPPRRQYSASCARLWLYRPEMTRGSRHRLRCVRHCAGGSKGGRQHVELNDRPVIHRPASRCPFHDIANATRMPPSQVCRFDPRSGPLLDPLTVVVGIVGPPLSFKKSRAFSLQGSDRAGQSAFFQSRRPSRTSWQHRSGAVGLRCPGSERDTFQTLPSAYVRR